MKFMNKIFSLQLEFKYIKIFLLMITLSICTLFLPTNVEGKSYDLENEVAYETTLYKFENLVNDTNIHPQNINSLNKNITINMKQIKGNAQVTNWSNEVLERVSIVIENCKGKFSSLDMILMPLNLNSNQWINH